MLGFAFVAGAILAVISALLALWSLISGNWMGGLFCLAIFSLFLGQLVVFQRAADGLKLARLSGSPRRSPSHLKFDTPPPNPLY